jgi:ankyrin repeat protein
VKIIQLLIARKADISMKDISGHAPLDYARMYKHRECIELLIVTGATGMNKVDLRIMTELEKV